MNEILKTTQELPKNEINKAERESKAINEDLLKYYLGTQDARSLIDWNDATEEDIKKLLQNPEAYADELELSEDEVSDIKDWIKQEKQYIETKKKNFIELKEKHPDNPLFKNNFENIPVNFVSVYHLTGESRIDKIGQEGLKPIMEALSDEEKKTIEEKGGWDRLKVDQIFDQAVRPNLKKKNFSRSRAVFAYNDYHTDSGMNKGAIVIEIKVDPKEVIVTNAEAYTEAMVNYQRNEDGNTNNLEKEYWYKAITLEEFRNLPLDERIRKFTFPEVVIPQSIDPKFMRVCGVEYI